jgi:cytidylate kinase
VTARFVIAIDGPSGAGKGTVARAIAGELVARHVDTGAMYRAVAWRALEEGLSLDDGPSVARLARTARLDLDGATVRIDGHDVSRAIRTSRIDAAATSVARLPEVRQVLVDRQRRLAGDGRLVMEGRDIGTVVFPQADVKIYLDAAPEERARRRSTDAARASQSAPPTIVANELAARDRLDRTRAVSPLVPAPDAVVIDTTGVSIDAVVERVRSLVRTRLASGR